MSLLVNLKDRACKLKSEARVLMIAYRDKRTPFATRVLIWVTIGYLLSPIDLIPDFIPVLGLLDDLIIVPALIALSIKLIPTAVIEDARIEAASNTERPKKNNWLFAAIIILIWLAALYALWKFASKSSAK